MRRLLPIGLGAALLASFAGAARADDVHLFVATALPPAAQIAVEELRAALTAHGDTVRDATALPKSDEHAIVVGVAREAETFSRLLDDARIAVSDRAESTAVAWIEDHDQTLVVAGSDERGLTYSLRDVTRGLQTTPRDASWSNAVTPAVESPFLRVRNVSLHLFNADCEREWFFSEAFWRYYFGQLSLARFNRCTLTLCDQTNYLCPPYAHLVPLPEYPGVKVEDCTPIEQAKNLAMLRRITELADEYAIDFDLGIWMQAPVPKWSAPVKVTGLPEGLAAADYCALGLRRIFDGCPSLDGVQLRMNAEAGVSEDEQTAFYTPLFRALAGVGRPLRVELRYKGLQDATIDAAVAAGLDVTVSTKFWAEHFGLPYHPLMVDSHYAADRYSFGTLLKKPRNYRVTYQLWNVGSQRVTVWGDPEYAARFAHSCTLGGGEGFEVFAPLTNKGYGNAPGAWPVVKDPAYRVGKWEQERYWAFYLSFGRKGFNPETPPAIWNREFRHRFQADAVAAAEGYRAASKVLPLVTAALLPGASEWSWWPEMDTGGGLREYSHIQTSDPGRFAAVREWQRTPEWRWEDWDARPGFAEERFGKPPTGRVSPVMIVERLRQTAGEIRAALAELARSDRSDEHAELRMLEVDLRLLAGLAEYHGNKLAAAAQLAIYETAGEKAYLQAAVERLQAAEASWKTIVAATDGVYSDNLVFGVAIDSPRSKLGHHHTGHWRDRLPELAADVAHWQAEAERAGAGSATETLSPLPRDFSVQTDVIQHEPPPSHAAGTPLTLHFVSSPVDRVVVLLRQLDQTQKWREYALTKDDDRGQRWSVTVPAEQFDGRYDVQYFFQASAQRHKPREEWVTACWPEWTKSGRSSFDEIPYFVLPITAK